ncbi:MAG TPA: FAD-binding protein [Mycobacteriales bacterium]
MDVLVVGAGLGGLAAAVALGRAGHRVTLRRMQRLMARHGPAARARDLALRAVPAGLATRGFVAQLRG